MEHFGVISLSDLEEFKELKYRDHLISVLVLIIFTEIISLLFCQYVMKLSVN